MLADQPVTNVMTAPVIILSSEQTIEEAVAILTEQGISGAPVADGDGRLVGLLDDTDLILSGARLHAPTTIEILGAYLTLPGERHRFESDLRAALGQTVGAVMETKPATVGLDGTLGDVATIILDRDVSRVPVLDAGGKVAGIVTRGDLVKSMF
ncbi:MAG: CBS domain-containing protein [Nitriliruptorales bacterium]|nr:CBS domain-containing protein [Nitriliruptorales bacterium]